MPLRSILNALRPDAAERQAQSVNVGGASVNTGKISARLWDVFLRTYDLGFTAFGGPPVHFQIFHKRFVDGNGKVPWIDEQTYQELFAIVQSLPGPGSTKHLFCTTLLHAGFLPALFVLLIWCLPGALGMFALALGVQRINEVLPAPAYALLSGLNASTVGIIALAAVQLARKSVTDPLTRLLVVGGGCAGLCYNALWYFPIIMVIGGVITVIWDVLLRARVGRLRVNLSSRRRRNIAETNPQRAAEESQPIPIAAISTGNGNDTASTRSRTSGPMTAEVNTEEPQRRSNEAEEQRTVPQAVSAVHHTISVKLSLFIIAAFFISFTVLMVLRGTLTSSPLPLRLFTSMYLAGTVIFGGGPVVIPLLREYVVEPGWVSPRDFLLGLALIQAFPGPNFNFAVFLGGLTLAPTSSTALGSFLGLLGIFFPGIILAVGFQGLWSAIRNKPAVVSALRGLNATAVGLVFTAVYRLWEIGYLRKEARNGASLAQEPWWVVVAALTYTACEWFKVPAAAAILMGGVLGIAWWGAVGR